MHERRKALPGRIDPKSLAVLIPEDGNARIALVTMPFGMALMPSIQLGLLKALLSLSGISADVYYLNLPFARELGYDGFHTLSNISQPMLGEWLFARAAFGVRDDDLEFLERFSTGFSFLLGDTGWSQEDLLLIRNRLAPEFIELCATLLPWDRYSAVGFSSSFQQNAASLALAHRIRTGFPQTLVVFGGANFDYPMGPEFMRAFPWIDAAFIGEADETFPKVVQRLLSGHEPEPCPGLAVRRGTDVLYGGPAPPVSDLGGLPVPDYDDFFWAANRLGMFEEWEHSGKIQLTFESSRGCWWGEKSRCTFCAVNPQTIGYRAKQPAQVVRELAQLAARHQWDTFHAVDNIMGRRFANEFCEHLRKGGHDFNILYQVKADLSREQIRALKIAGITTIQPGIESLSTRLLGLMNKGTTALANVEILKWTRCYSVRVFWNLLTRIPGEIGDDYARQVDWIRSIRHLAPPDKVGAARIERFSLFHSQPENYGFEGLRPEASYFYVYPSEVELNRVACFFDSDGKNVLGDGAYENIAEEVSQWRRAWNRYPNPPSLTCRKVLDLVVIEDARCDDGVCEYTFSGLEAAVYLFFETRRRQGDCLDHLASLRGETASPKWLEDVTHRMVEARLMIREGEWLLSLAIPAWDHL
jgi:ribosomal peptide maturation radical SAM protein 1